MSKPCIVVAEPANLALRLSELGLTPSVLMDVVKHYARTVVGMTDDHPSWCTGIAPAGEAVFALRQLTRPLGWLREEHRGFALTIHPKALLAVNIAKGDLNTGNPLVEPTSHSEKGICTEEAIAGNQLTFDFGKDDDIAEIEDCRPTWYLLMRVMDKAVKYEFSLPIALSEDKHISKWAERLVFADIPIVDISKNEDQGQSEDAVDIVPTITRKNG